MSAPSPSYLSRFRVYITQVLPLECAPLGNERGPSLFEFHEFLMYRYGIRNKKRFQENALRYYAKRREEISLAKFLVDKRFSFSLPFSLSRHRKLFQASFSFFPFLSFSIQCNRNKSLSSRTMFLRDLDFLNPPLKRDTPAVLLARLFPQFYPELYFHVYPTGWIVHHYNGTHAASAVYVFKERIFA